MAASVYCISLADKPERFAAACEEAHRVGLCRLVTFYRPRRPTDAELARANDQCPVKARGFFGSWESHRRVSHIASSASRPQHTSGDADGRVLVLEDDFRVLDGVDGARLRRAGRQIDGLTTGWEVFYLGHQPAAGYPVGFDGVFRVASCWIHAVVLSADAQRRVADEAYVEHTAALGREETLDGWIMRDFVQYATFPQFVVQSGIGSDNLAAADRWTRLIEWWTRFHRDHSFAIELAVLVVIPLFVCLLLAFLLYRLARSAVAGASRSSPQAPSAARNVGRASGGSAEVVG